MKAPVAGHPLPQGGEGWKFNLMQAAEPQVALHQTSRDLDKRGLSPPESMESKVGGRRPALSKLVNAYRGQRGIAVCCHEYRVKTKGYFSLAPLGERGDRKAGGEGVSTNMHTLGPV